MQRSLLTVVAILLAAPTLLSEAPAVLEEWLPGKHRDEMIRVLGEPSESLSSDAVLVYEMENNTFSVNHARGTEPLLSGSVMRAIKRIHVRLAKDDRVSSVDVEYTGPYLAGAGDVTLPVLKKKARVKPVYPREARLKLTEGRVIMQAVINKEGDVVELEVLTCNQPGYGFEEAAKNAVRQWKYGPGTLEGKPVDVYFTVRIDFEIGDPLMR